MTLWKILRKIKSKIMNLCKVGFLILSFVASYVDSDSLISKGQKYYFNSCQCGKAVAEGYFFTNYQNSHKNVNFHAVVINSDVRLTPHDGRWY